MTHLPLLQQTCIHRTRVHACDRFPVNVDVSIFERFACVLDARSEDGTPYAFVIDEWSGSHRMSDFLRLTEEGRDMLRCAPLTLGRKKDAILRGCRDVLSCMTLICDRYTQSSEFWNRCTQTTFFEYSRKPRPARVCRRAEQKTPPRP